MTLTFYWSNNDPKRVDKINDLTSKGSLSGVKLKETTNPLEPRFIIKKNQILYNSNYFYCDATNRYYFLNKDSIEFMPGGRYSFTGRVDVLYSFHDDILASPAWVEIGGGYPSEEEQLIEQQYPFRNDFSTISQDFPNQYFGVGESQRNHLIILSP